MHSDLNQPSSFFIMGGPCTLESKKLGLEVGSFLKKICHELGFTYIFKSSFDKANRTSGSTPRGPGINAGLQWIEEIKETLKVPVLTDVHTVEQILPAARVCDVLQIPAFLCDNKSLLLAAAQTNCAIQLKKSQIMGHEELMAHGNFVQNNRLKSEKKNSHLFLCERGSLFGYNNLVVDFKNFYYLKHSGYNVIFDATHSAQLPGADGHSTGGCRETIATLAVAAVAAGVDGLFLEVHPNPEAAWSDASTQLDFEQARHILEQVSKIHKSLK